MGTLRNAVRLLLQRSQDLEKLAETLARVDSALRPLRAEPKARRQVGVHWSVQSPEALKEVEREARKWSLVAVYIEQGRLPPDTPLRAAHGSRKADRAAERAERDARDEEWRVANRAKSQSRELVDERPAAIVSGFRMEPLEDAAKTRREQLELRLASEAARRHEREERRAARRAKQAAKRQGVEGGAA